MDNPTRQKHGMYDSLNRKDADHGTPHKDLNAAAPAEFNRHPIGYSRMVDGVNFRSPVQVRHIEGYKSEHGNLEAHPQTSNTFGQSDSDFQSKQIPNTSPKEPHTSSTKGPMRSIHERSRSNVFHD